MELVMKRTMITAVAVAEPVAGRLRDDDPQ